MENNVEMVVPPLPNKNTRVPVREEDPRTRAARRAAELRNHAKGDLDEGNDKYYIPLEDIPPDWEYEWKRKSVFNVEDPAYMVQLARKGWEPVPASRHPEFMPISGKYNTIERDGMILMERPKEISDEARARDAREARFRMQAQKEHLQSTPDGQFERSRPVVKSTYESIPIPE